MAKDDTSLSSSQKEKILRDIVVALDARWFLKTTAEAGFDAATRINFSVNESIGKTEIRRMLAELGHGSVRDMKDFKKLMETGCALFFPDDHKYALEIIDADTLVGHVLDCYVYRNVSKAGAAGIYRCSAANRFRAWLNGFGIEGDISTDGDSKTCNGACNITFKTKW